MHPQQRSLRQWSFTSLLVVLSAFTVSVALYLAFSLHKLVALGENQNIPLTLDDTATPRRASFSTSRLWHDMVAKEQDQALQRVGVLIQKYGRLFQNHSKVHSPWRQGQSAKETLTDSTACAEFGSGWGAHYLCGPMPAPPPERCHFISFGISRDYTFDVDLANQWKCHGFAGDPTAVHNSKLHPLVTFQNVAANTLNQAKPHWWTVTLPSLVKSLQLDYVDVLKMDCEGCEYALPRDVLKEDPTFFHRIGQISLEVHVAKRWINTNETLYYFGLLFELMEEAGLELAWSHLTTCVPAHELRGCLPQFHEWGFSCGLLGENRKSVWAEGTHSGSCHNFLFARRSPNRPKLIKVAA